MLASSSRFLEPELLSGLPQWYLTRFIDNWTGHERRNKHLGLAQAMSRGAGFATTEMRIEFTSFFSSQGNEVLAKLVLAFAPSASIRADFKTKTTNRPLNLNLIFYFWKNLKYSVRRMSLRDKFCYNILWK